MSKKLDITLIKACILGHAVGDALGVPVEFFSREELAKDPVTGMLGFGTYPVPAGCWSDDTSMTLCALDSLAKGKLDYDDVMRNFGKWYFEDEFTPTGKLFDVGNTCSFAIDNYITKHMDIDHCGLSNERSNGNGSLMRIIPFALYYHFVMPAHMPSVLWNIVAKASALTHAHTRSVIGCCIYSTMIEFLLNKPTKESAIYSLEFFKKWNNESTQFEHYERLYQSDFYKLDRSQIRSSGYVVDTLEAAVWCLMTTDSYKDCVLKAVNLGDDTDTVAAVAGGLAGALYGFDSIPKEWLNTLVRREYIEALCDKAAESWQQQINTPADK